VKSFSSAHPGPACKTLPLVLQLFFQEKSAHAFEKLSRPRIKPNPKTAAPKNTHAPKIPVRPSPTSRGNGSPPRPWRLSLDREQTHSTLRTYLIEEAYEVLDVLDSKDDSRFAEELGDLLLQVLFHAQ